MKIGICTALDNIERATAAGFDYIEPGLKDIAALGDGAFDELAARLSDSGIICEACNVMLPGEISLYESDHAEIFGYISKAYARASRLGIRYIVFGSGGARRYRENMERTAAWDILVGLARRFGDIACENGLTIVMEPLNASECNILISVEEALEFVREVKHPNVALLADFYHMRLGGESMDIILKTEGLLKHAHIANSTGRAFPLSDSEDIYADFIRALKAINYSGGISVEGATHAFDEDSAKTIRFLKEMAAPKV